MLPKGEEKSKNISLLKNITKKGVGVKKGVNYAKINSLDVRERINPKSKKVVH